MSARLQAGFSLGVVLVLSTAVVTLLSLVTANWVWGLTREQRLESSQGSRRLAEGCLQLAIARLIQNPFLSPDKLPLVELKLDSYSQGRGVVVFDKDEAERLKVPLSLNNLTSQDSRPGWGTTVVQAQTANLVGVGRFRNLETRVEVVLNVPAYNYVVGSSVPLESSDGLRVFALDSAEALAGGFSSLSENSKGSGHLVTNAGDWSGGAALKLSGSQTLIQGNAQSAGSVAVEQGALVTGEQRPFSDPSALPKLDLKSFDTGGKDGCNVLQASSLGAATLSGFNRHQGNMSFSDGLVLDGGVIYVDGDVTIRGGLRGKGAVVATGSVTVEGGGVLQGDNQSAILAGGTVALRGTSAQSAEFRGAIYTEGDLECRYVDVAGAIVVNNPSQNGHARLDFTTLAECKDLGTLDILVKTTTTTLTPGVAVPYPPLVMDISALRLQTQYIKDADMLDQPDAPLYPTTIWGGANWNKFQFDSADPMKAPPGFPITHPATQNENWIEIGMPASLPDPLAVTGIEIGGNTPRSTTLPPTPSFIKEEAIIPADFPMHVNVGHLFPQGWVGSTAEARVRLQDSMNAWPHDAVADPAAAIDAAIATISTDIARQLPAAVEAFNANSKLYAQMNADPAHPGQVATHTVVTVPWKLDLSKFVKLSDSIRVLSWRRI